ncbi:hypothetical protein sscle_14g101920 [Sclerotinia sclerotiorum 1980 UF-70]|uniref:Uncharacterized protein n=1 Tax=Sclerotinia sclerotiorum (strain ATCC 18683 / 1980 / Ss-1) TaxID=665079 RepID=A0A1D9QKT8_SCLS1|nr:hypothetical protein sscle_14g101920 [Sclerotinia sclerotiorum 1980 UF-70]
MGDDPNAHGDGLNIGLFEYGRQVLGDGVLATPLGRELLFLVSLRSGFDVSFFGINTNQNVRFDLEPW